MFFLFHTHICWNRVESEESEDLHNKYKGMTADSDEKKLKQIIRSTKRIQERSYLYFLYLGGACWRLKFSCCLHSHIYTLHSHTPVPAISPLSRTFISWHSHSLIYADNFGAPLKMPTANHSLCFWKVIPQHASKSSPSYGIIYRITGGFLNTATSILKRVTGTIFTISKCFHKGKPTFYLLVSS
jgi:hypothetical protein